MLGLLGSPPRMRGKRGTIRIFARKGGITPAYAGKTYIINAPICQYLGSPPRMRGKRRWAFAFRRKGRITPAYAGKTVRSRVDGLGGLDHPRVCGENAEAAESCQAAMGSPPRMRGKHR